MKVLFFNKMGADAGLVGFPHVHLMLGLCARMGVLAVQMWDAAGGLECYTMARGYAMG